MALNERQKKFVDEYLIDLNATNAAIRAGYSEKTAYSIGHENLNKPEIQAQIKERRKDLQERTEVTQDKVIAELSKIGFAKLTDFVEYKTVKRVIDYEDGEPVIDWAMMVDAIDSSKVDGSAIQEVSISKDGTFKFKLYSKLDALEKLGRHLGMFDGKQQDGTADAINDGILAIADLITNPRKVRELPDNEE